MFQKHSRIISVELLHKLQDLKCQEKGNVHDHFDKMLAIREQLSSMGQDPSDDSFVAIILGSLPTSYNPHLSALIASARVTSTDLTPDILMATIINEYDQCTTKGKKSTPSNDNTAYTANSNGKKYHFKGKCHNCGKKGHIKADCWADSGGKARENPSSSKAKGKKSDTAVAAKDKDNEDEPKGVLLAHGWDDEVDQLTEVDKDDIPSIDDILGDDEEAHTKTFDYTMLANCGREDNNYIELYNSGASHHMSLY
ncbi:hypothetical protein BDR04DRAFT_1163522 [Suillus decipiens]|nr:hypothetical protein BDR04DRAFT_1163522 [Suillus decipiens]